MKRFTIHITLALIACSSIMAQNTDLQNNPLSVRRPPRNSATTARDTTATRRPNNPTSPSRGAFSPTTTTPPTTTPRSNTAQPATTPQRATNTPPVAPRAQQQQQQAATNNNTGVSIRAQQTYKTQREVPANPVWKREVYRTLDLTKPENAGLADPATPTDTRQNLFSLIFKLLAENKLTAYEYTLDGNEQLDNAHRIKFKDLLDRYYIHSRPAIKAGTTDTILVVDPSDVPSNEVLSYYIKEVYYYDQQTSSFHTTVEAFCPRLHRAGDFDSNTVTYPMFWIRTADLAPYLNQIQIPVSEYNNAATVRLDDYFAMQLYKGDIYKTSNPSGRTLSQIAPTDSALIKEQKLIEEQLSGIEDVIWHSNNTATTVVDSAAVATQPSNNERRTQSRRQAQPEAAPAAKPASSQPSAPKASVRRERR